MSEFIAEEKVYKISLEAEITNGKKETIKGFYYTEGSEFLYGWENIDIILTWISSNTPIKYSWTSMNADCADISFMAGRDMKTREFTDLTGRAILIYRNYKNLIENKILTPLVVCHRSTYDDHPSYYLNLNANCAVCSNLFQIDITCEMNKKWEKNWVAGIRSEVLCQSCAENGDEWSKKELAQYYMEMVYNNQYLYGIKVEQVLINDLKPKLRQKMKNLIEHKEILNYYLVSNGEDEMVVYREVNGNSSYILETMQYKIMMSEIETRRRNFTIIVEACSEKEAEDKARQGDYDDEIDCDYDDSNYDDLEIEEIQEMDTDDDE